MRAGRRNLLLLAVALILLAAGGRWLAGAWLESSGGRGLLERELSRRVGLPVRLAGDFDLMLLPSVGVSGTRLVIGSERAGSAMFSASDYEVSVALYPLLRDEVLVEWVRLGGGVLHPDGMDTPLHIESLTISGFMVDRPTPFTLRVPDMGAAQGVFRWQSARQMLEFPELSLDTAGGMLRGRGCIFFRSPLSLRFDLSAGFLDLDAARRSLPFAMPEGDDGLEDRADLRFRLAAAELHAGGAIAREAEFSLGGDPDCSR
jgi:hypothetical protein